MAARGLAGLRRPDGGRAGPVEPGGRVLAGRGGTNKDG